MARRKTEKMSVFALRMIFLLILSVVAIGGLIFAYTYGPLSPKSSRASVSQIPDVDPQTGEYYDLQITSYITTSSEPQTPGTIYKAKTQFDIGGNRVSSFRQMYGFLQSSSSTAPLITFNYAGPSYPPFRSTPVNLIPDNDCIDLHSSTVKNEGSYIATFCYRNSEFTPNGGQMGATSYNGNPFLKFTYTGSRPTMLQFLTTAFNKYKNSVPRDGGNPGGTRVTYLTIDSLNSSLSDFKNVVYTIQGLTSGLSNEQYDNLCNTASPSKKYLKQTYIAKPEGGNNEDITNKLGGCSFTYESSYLKPFFLSLYVEGGVPLPISPTPTIGSTAPTVSPTGVPTAINIVADFSPRPRLKKGETVLVGKSPFEVRFVNESWTLHPEPRYEWDFGNDGKVSTEINPTHKFRLREGEATRTFKVTLKVTDIMGESATKNLRVRVTK